MTDNPRGRAMRGTLLRPLSEVGSRPAKSQSKVREGAWSRIPHALVDDLRLSSDARALMIYRLSRTNSWTLRWRDLQKRFGWSKSRFYSALTELTEHGYLARKQSRPADGRWGRAEEAVNRGAAGVEGRKGFQQLPRRIVDDRRLDARHLLSLAVMRSHAPSRPFYPRDLTRALGCHPQTALKALRSLVKLGLVVRTVARDAGGKFGQAVYQLAEHHANGIAVSPRTKNRETVLRETVDEDTYEGSPLTKNHKQRTSHDFREAKGASDEEILSIDIDWLYDLPGNYHDEFNVSASLEAIPETYDEISDADLLECLKDATGNRVHADLTTLEGLQAIRLFMAAGVHLEDVLDIIWRRIGRKPGKFLNGWGVIAMPIATEILVQGLNTRGQEGDDDEDEIGA